MTMKFLLHKDKEEKWKNANAQNSTFAGRSSLCSSKTIKVQAYFIFILLLNN